MELKELEERLDECMMENSDDDKIAEYTDALCTCLETEKVSAELIAIVVRGIEIDRGANFFDYAEGMSQNELQDVWKMIRNNAEITGAGEKAVKFLSGLFYAAFVSETELASLRGNVLSFLTKLICKKTIPEELYAPVLLDYFVLGLPLEFRYPIWENLGVEPETVNGFCEMMLHIIEWDTVAQRNDLLRQWLNAGKRYAEAELRKREPDERALFGRIDELRAITEYYGELEQSYRDLLHEMERKRRELDEARKEIEERKEINDAFDALKRNDERAILQDIANELKAEYSDFMDSENDEMDLVLGEIYREKIRNIFKLLRKKGIQVG